MSRPKYIFKLAVLFCCIFVLLPENSAAAWPPESAYINGVIGHPQQHALSCESRSASDFAAFFGYSISEAEILAYVTKYPRTDNPNYGFVGSPDGIWGQIPPNSYGVHSNPIESALRKYDLPVFGERNLSWDFVRSEIANGRPVIVWIIGSMWSGTPVEYTDSLGRVAIVAPYEHTVILIGYNATTVWVVDAYDGLTKSYPVSSFLTSWQVLENQGVFFPVEHVDYTEKIYLPLLNHMGIATIQATEQEVTVPKSYTVQSGDTLGKIAYQFGIPWERLAAINGLGQPFTLYTGQVLQLQP